MESLLLVNPRRRRRKAKGRRKGRMPAALARYWSTHRRGRKRRHVARRRHARRAVAVNPRRRHRRHHYRRVRRNPSLRGLSGMGRGVVKGVVIPGAIGATGAVALDVVMGYATPYLPASLQSGWFNVAVKIAGAIGVGMVAGKVLGRDKGRIVTLGGVTVVMYSVVRGLLKQVAPTMPGLSGLGMQDYTPYGRGMGAYMQGPTRTPGIQGLGYVSPAATVGSAVPMSPRMGAYMAPAGMNVAHAMGDYGDGM